MIPKVKQKVANWNQKDTNTEPKRALNVKKTRTGRNRPTEDEQIMSLAPLGRFGGRFRRPLVYEGVPASIVFV